MNRHEESLLYALNILKQPDYKKYIHKIFLYGSCARQEEKYDSDVDLLLYMDETTPKQLIKKLRSDIIPDDYTLPEIELKITLSDEPTSSHCFNENIKKDGILLWERI